MKIFLFLAMWAIVFAGGAHSGEAVTVFGLPLGGKMPYRMQICPSSRNDLKEVCWRGQPARDEDGERGVVDLPSTDVLPKWAEHAKFELHFDQYAELQEIFLWDIKSYQRRTIEESISLRFGSPFKPLAVPGMPSSAFDGPVYWDRSDISISMECHQDCDVNFTSARLRSAREMLFRNMKRLDSSRPLSP